VSGEVIANQIPMWKAEENPLKSLESALAFSSQDWSEAADFAWIYGIVCGWEDEDGDSYPQLQVMYGWSDDAVARLKRLHQRFQEVSERVEP
jgi:hypothetical protein